MLGLIFSNNSPAAMGHKGPLLGTSRSFQVIYAAHQLGIQIPEHIILFPHFPSNIRDKPISYSLVYKTIQKQHAQSHSDPCLL